MIVGVDCDEVLYPFVDQARMWLVNECGRDPADLPTPTSWKIEEAWGLTDEEWHVQFVAAIKAGVLFGQGDPLDGAVEGLARLCDLGHKVVVVTARDIPDAAIEATQQTYRWLADLGIPFSGIHISRDKGVVETDIFFEDHHVHYDALDDEFETFPILMHRPWNADHDGRRVVDWGEFVDAVEFLTVVCEETGDDPQFTMRSAWEARLVEAEVAEELA